MYTWFYLIICSSSLCLTDLFFHFSKWSPINYCLLALFSVTLDFFTAFLRPHMQTCFRSKTVCNLWKNKRVVSLLIKIENLVKKILLPSNQNVHKRKFHVLCMNQCCPFCKPYGRNGMLSAVSPVMYKSIYFRKTTSSQGFWSASQLLSYPLVCSFASSVYRKISPDRLSAWRGVKIVQVAGTGFKGKVKSQRSQLKWAFTFTFPSICHPEIWRGTTIYVWCHKSATDETDNENCSKLNKLKWGDVFCYR